MNRKKTPRAFSLFELLLILASVVLLGFFVFKNLDIFSDYRKNSRAKTYVSQTLAAPLMAFKLSTGRYPTTQEGLRALVAPPKDVTDKWTGPYINDIEPDPWQRTYNYRFPAKNSPEGYDLWSNGADGKPETNDDVGNW